MSARVSQLGKIIHVHVGDTLLNIFRGSRKRRVDKIPFLIHGRQSRLRFISKVASYPPVPMYAARLV